MNKIINYILGFILILVLSFIATESTSQIDITKFHKITNDKVALRAMPLKNSKRLAILNFGDVVQLENYNDYNSDRVDGIDGSWVKIKSNEVDGFVFDQYVSIAKTCARSDTNFFYIVDTFKHCIGLSIFEQPNWYVYKDKSISPCSSPQITWRDSCATISYNNEQNMIATNLYLPSDLNLSRLFSLEQNAIEDTTYMDYKYALVGQDSILIEAINSDQTPSLIKLKSFSNSEYLYHNIESLVDINGDGVLDILFTTSSNYDQHFYFLLSKSGTIDFTLLPITFKEFPYEGC